MSRAAFSSTVGDKNSQKSTISAQQAPQNKKQIPKPYITVRVVSDFLLEMMEIDFDNSLSRFYKYIDIEKLILLDRSNLAFPLDCFIANLLSK